MPVELAGTRYPGRGIDTGIVVKVNVAEVLQRELSRASWACEPVTLGTNTGPYQPAEGRYPAQGSRAAAHAGVTAWTA